MGSTEDYEKMTAASYAMNQRAKQVMPGGNSRTAVFTTPYPLYVRSGQGCRVTDLDGTTRLDFLGNSTALIHGHAHPHIVAAVTEALGRGSSFGMPTAEEVELAEALCGRNPDFEQARFTSTGTEAVMVAIQAARAYTGKPKIAKLAGAYHGPYDAVALNNDGSDSLISHSKSAGVPAAILANTVIVPFNEPEAALHILREHVDELACVLIDPMPWRIGLIAASAEYLSALRQFCDETGVLLVSDEVGSFRAGFHGAAHEVGCRADLTVLGKIIGGGLPIGAVVGSREVMSVFDPTDGAPRLPHSGSYNANPISMTAGRASLELLTEPEFHRLSGLGAQVRDSMRKSIGAAGLSWEVNGTTSLFRVIARGVPGSSLSTGQLNHLLFRELLLNGVLVGESGLGCVSTPMDSDDVAEFAEAFDRAVTGTVSVAQA